MRWLVVPTVAAVVAVAWVVGGTLFAAAKQPQPSADGAAARLPHSLPLPPPPANPLGFTPPRPQPDVLPQPSDVRLDVPVAFQLTRTKIVGPGASTVTESFRETWTLQVLPGDRLNLRSPRAEVPAYPAGTSGEGGVPRALVVSQRDFSRLVGVEPAASDDDADPSVPPTGPGATPITLQLGKAGAKASGTDVSLTWSEEEHYAVHIDVGTTAVF